MYIGNTVKGIRVIALLVEEEILGNILGC